MIPIAMELGAGSEVRSPMAISVIGGFTTSTLLTLVVVPVLFTYVDNLVRGIMRLLGGEDKRVQVAMVGASGEDTDTSVTRQN
jgi:hypothetical protein